MASTDFTERGWVNLPGPFVWREQVWGFIPIVGGPPCILEQGPGSSFHKSGLSYLMVIKDLVENVGETLGSFRPFVYDGGFHYTHEIWTSKLWFEFSVRRKGMSTVRTLWWLILKYLCFVDCVDHSVQRNIVGTDKNENVNGPRISYLGDWIWCQLVCI